MIVSFLVSTVVCLGGQCFTKPTVAVGRPVVCTPRGCHVVKPRRPR